MGASIDTLGRIPNMHHPTKKGAKKGISDRLHRRMTDDPNSTPAESEEDHVEGKQSV